MRNAYILVNFFQHGEVKDACYEDVTGKRLLHSLHKKCNVISTTLHNALLLGLMSH